MNTSIFPANPYTRSPIKKREELAGRAKELKAIRYYLGLTASGQSPHLALIGQRGIGKTSLLNCSEAIASELKLLPIRLNMNEQKTESPGRFWHDLYSTLILTMAKVGCWGGLHGPIYAELFRMLHTRQPGNLDKAVLQAAFAFSCNQGKLDDFECPDALVEYDLQVCVTELNHKGITGLALLIDEADCLGKNVPLLQMFRNIFQTVNHCSLLLAGTEAVFPALSEVFSPIPRQFHRIDIKPFARWSDTMALLRNPLPKELASRISPDPSAVEELHELCGGDPAEVQLYCHHMYRSVEDGSTKQMSLAPQVFREVLREYRSNTPADVDGVLNAIERLPDKLLFESLWLSRRNLSLEENVQISILRRELSRKGLPSHEDRESVRREITDGYKTLFELGITKSLDSLQLAGAPLTAGFWKSYVEVERRKRWTWRDDPYTELLTNSIVYAMGEDCGTVRTLLSLGSDDAVTALRTLRGGEIPTPFDDGMAELIVSALAAEETGAKYAVDIALQVTSSAGKHTHRYRVLEKPDTELNRTHFEEWISSRQMLLCGNNLAVVITEFNRWQLPTPEELHRLGRVSGYSVPGVFGDDPQITAAIEKFASGDIQGAADQFIAVLAVRDDGQTRNNLAFCQLLMGQTSEALENAGKAVASSYDPLHEMNRGVAEFLSGDIAGAAKSLENALDQLENNTEYGRDVLYVLILDSEGKAVSAHKDIPVDAAILINLCRMRQISHVELEAELTRLYSEKGKVWLGYFV